MASGEVGECWLSVSGKTLVSQWFESSGGEFVPYPVDTSWEGEGTWEGSFFKVELYGDEESSHLRL